MKLIPLLVSLVPLTSLTLASPTPNRSRRALTTSSASSLDASYDYIIVGGGLAGSVLARRLASSDKNIKILLIEAGSDQESNPNVYEAGKYQSTFDTPLDYAYPTVPQRSQGSKAIRAGKMLGGSTGINGLAWTKPHSFQIDALEQVGNQGVDWNLLNGYMKSAERFSPPGSAYLAEEDCHGTQGPIAVQYDPASSPLAFETRFNQTVVQSEGLRFAGDLTCGNPEGAGQVANTRDGDVRVTSYRGYLYNQDLPGLTILTDTQVGKITFSSLRATGVEFQSSGTTRTIRASSEIIMAAGSIGTPKILQHSGIGPRSVLSSAGVPTILDLPVGMGLVDQVTTTTNWQFAEQRGGGQVILFPSFDDLFQGNEADRMRSILENDLAGYASAAQDAGAVPNGDALLKVLEIQRDWILNRNAGIAESFDYSYSSGGSVNTLGYDSWYLLPFGRGSVKITNSDAYDTAALSIDPRYFSTEFDRLAQGAITRFTRTVSLAQPLASVVQSEGTPGDQVPQGASLDEWADWSERNYRSNWHPIGTVGMMSRDMGGCVGSDYKLYGIEGLRVVDGSILPFQVSSHLMSVLYGLAERAAEVILADYQPGSGGVGNETTPVVPPTPPASGGGKSIHPNGDTTKCLAVGGTLADGAPVQIGNCDGSASQSWTINRGSTIIQVKGTNYCFDSGDSPSNGALAKIWTCYQGIPAQTWWLTDAGDDHIALQDSGLCLDLPDGDKTAGKRLQLWECAGQNNNQKWTLS